MSKELGRTGLAKEQAQSVSSHCLLFDLYQIEPPPPLDPTLVKPKRRTTWVAPRKSNQTLDRR
jgi:hypothetical protein